MVPTYPESHRNTARRRGAFAPAGTSDICMDPVRWLSPFPQYCRPQRWLRLRSAYCRTASSSGPSRMDGWRFHPDCSRSESVHPAGNCRESASGRWRSLLPCSAVDFSGYLRRCIISRILLAWVGFVFHVLSAGERPANSRSSMNSFSQNSKPSFALLPFACSPFGSLPGIASRNFWRTCAQQPQRVPSVTLLYPA